MKGPHIPNWLWQGSVAVVFVGSDSPMASSVMPQLSTPWLFCAYCKQGQPIIAKAYIMCKASRSSKQPFLLTEPDASSVRAYWSVESTERG